jgi:hypothetical protein
MRPRRELRWAGQWLVLTGVPIGSSLDGMTWTSDEELQQSIRSGIREGFDLIRGTRRSLTEDQERVVADAVVKHLERGDWRIERGAPPDARRRD